MSQVVELLISYLVFLDISRIDPKYCPQVKGFYGVTTNKSIKIVNSCGQTKSESCVFYNVNTLNDAVITCNIITDICTSFTYSENTKIMNIVSDVDQGTGDYNIYTRQYSEDVTVQ